MSLLLKSLDSKLISLFQKNMREHFIVARPKMSVASMPDGVVLERRKIVGPRVIIKNRRHYGNVRNLIARWPEAGLGESENFKLVCVLEGTCDFPIGNYGLKFGEGIFLIIPPRTPHPEGVLLPYHGNNGFCDMLNILLHPQAVQCYITRSRQEDDRVRFIENYLFKNVRLTTTFALLMEEMVEDGDNSNSIGADLLGAFLKSLRREIAEKHYINPGPVGRPMPQRKESGDFKAELLRYIQAHVNQQLTLEGVARGMHLSRSQFTCRVREETGQSFIELLTDYRISEAKVLLRDSDWTITAIAGFLGFKTPAYFYNVFKHVTGETPGEFRKTKNK